jgi:hypothetical protein
LSKWYLGEHCQLDFEVVCCVPKVHVQILDRHKSMIQKNLLFNR